MGLETRRVSETRKVPEEIKRELLARDLKELIDSLPTDDIDQQWVKENESKEFSFTTSNQKNDNNQKNNNNQILQDLFTQMDRIGAFRKKTSSDSKKQEMTEEEEWKELENLIRGSKQDTSEIKNLQTEMIDLRNLENKNENNETIESVDNPSVQPPVIDQVSPIKEIPQPQEPVIADNVAEIEELNNKIDKKYDLLISKLGKLYNSELIKPEANSIRNDLKSLMDIKNRSVEELRKVNEALNSLISRYAILEQKAEEVKATDDFRINQQAKQLNFLRDYQNQLEKNYGKYWFGKMTKQEKEQYITLFTAAHKVSRKTVEKQIEDSITIAYNEIIAEGEQKKQQQTQFMTNEVKQEHRQFEGDYYSIIKYNIRMGVEDLKQIKAILKLNTTREQFEEFSYLYNALLQLNRYTPTNQEEEQQQLTQSYDIIERIEQMKNNLNNISSKSR